MAVTIGLYFQMLIYFNCKEVMDMDWIKQMNQAIEYIESQLEYEIDYKKVAQVAQCSEYHFQRMFS